MDVTPIPAVLRAKAQWVCWRTEIRDGTHTKVPVDPVHGGYASVADPETWGSFTAAQRCRRRTPDIEGAGFVFTADDPFVGVDLDDCREPATGAVADWAVDVVRRLASYTEVSPSGTGFHVLVRGQVPRGGNRRGDLEMYEADRYFTVTGEHVAGAPTEIRDRVEALTAVHDAYIGAADSEEIAVDGASGQQVPLSDEALLETARNAANGDKFRRLWNGDTAGYPSHSEADLALCSLLAFWTGGDTARIERLFARSGLVREKWRQRPGYRERTIRRAVQGCSDFYDPGQ
ncbi:hypothetical protein QA600_18465 [Natronococcus sp. A-GB1]|uniref:phage NrS-1 polymerase family protein n=1 Tax=Natronococcus sp. A-GB1 TaxID=3037648 RepID=UPI0024201609|nr:hypothetical protein [Natronococcus sp. A-GB1]MDG5761317.1 hypothetical protein [Natronococcus sp. A-GB1]